MHDYCLRNTNPSPEADVKLPNGTTVKIFEIQKWLRSWMDRELNFKIHIKTTYATAMRVFMMIAQLEYIEIGLSQKHLRQQYITCVTRVSDFGSKVWWKNDKVQCKTLQKMQSQVLPKMVGAVKAEMGILAVDVRLERLRRKYSTSILTMPPTDPIRELLPNSFPRGQEN